MITFLRVISWSLNRLPSQALYALGEALGLIWYFLVRFRRSIVRENLRLALGTQLAAEELSALNKENFKHYGHLLVEVLLSMTWDLAKYRSQTQVEGLENIEPFLKSKQGGVFLSAHIGNWELALGMATALGIPIDAVVKRATNPLAQHFLNWYRTRIGADIFIETGTAKDVLRSISKGRYPVFLLDQFMGPPIGLPVQFFGKLAGTAVGLALLVEKRPFPVIPAYTYRDVQGGLHMCFLPAIEIPNLSEDKDTRLYQRTQAYNNALEQIVRLHPAQWLWLHRRWKPFLGEARWKLPRAAFATVLFALITGCTSLGPSATGIDIPPDPTVSVVTTEDTPAVSQTPAPELTPPEKLSPPTKPTAKSKKKPVKEEFALNFKTFTSDQIPFEIGEELEIDLSWMALPAGRAKLELRDGGQFNGRSVYHAKANVLSSKLVDAIYHVDNTIESYLDRQFLIPYKFLLHMFESAQKKETRVVFDHKAKKAHYWAKRISERMGNEDNNRIDEFFTGSQDMFSALYYARALNYEMKQRQVVHVYENGQNMEIEVVPVAQDFINTKVGAFQCWKLSVMVKLNNIFKPTGDMFLWLSDDSKKYPVKFEAKVKIGSLYGFLTKIKDKS